MKDEAAGICPWATKRRREGMKSGLAGRIERKPGQVEQMPVESSRSGRLEHEQGGAVRKQRESN